MWLGWSGSNDMTRWSLPSSAKKRVKKWNRAWKIKLIEAENPDWLDLATRLGFEPLAQPQQER